MISAEDLQGVQGAVDAVTGLMEPMKGGAFSDKLSKISVYLGSMGKSLGTYGAIIEKIRHQGGDPERQRREVEAKVRGLRLSAESSVRFARMNLDQAVAQALDELVHKPRSANRTDEAKRQAKLKEWFDTLEDPGDAMLDHHRASSDPLDKYLIAGRWGHEYLRTRRKDLEDFDQKLCEIIGCPDTPAARLVLAYGRIHRAIDKVEAEASRAAEEMSGQ